MERLAKNGIFWIETYEMDAETMERVEARKNLVICFVAIGVPGMALLCSLCTLVNAAFGR